MEKLNNESMPVILVTGGYGMVGKNLQDIIMEMKEIKFKAQDHTKESLSKLLKEK
jgi:hypothetical protein